MDECIFCKIIKGEIPSRKIYENENALAFLDINPANAGHALVIPKKHYQTIISIDTAELKSLIEVVKNIAIIIKEELKAEGLNVLQSNGGVAGQLIPHLHFHLIPRFKDDKVVFTWQKKELSAEEAEQIRVRIYNRLNPKSM